MTTRWMALGVAGVLAIAGCSSDGESSSAGSTATDAAGTSATLTTDAPTTPPPTTAAPTTAAPTTAPPTTEAAAEPAAWELVPGDETCACADGSEFNLWVHEGDPSKVVLFFQGGGACFGAAMCAFGGGFYDYDVDATDDPSTAAGIFNLQNPANPFKDWSWVFVPYCTGDVHIGDNTQDYGDGLVVEHNGIANATFGLDELERRFPDPGRIFVTGSSAGGVPAPLFAGLASDRFPDASITALSDASGAYPAAPGINEAIGALWGTFDARPDWPETASLTPGQWSIPGLFSVAGMHDPDIVMARHDHAFDEVQSRFSSLAGIDASQLDALIDGNAAEIEASGVPVASYVAPGSVHTILGRPIAYTQEVNGVKFIDWLTDLANGTPVEDVHCAECT